MHKHNSLIAAIENLTTAINSGNSSTDSTITTTIFSTVIATIGSIVAVLFVDWIKQRYFAPITEFERLRRKVNSSLSMYACDYTNQIDLATATKEVVERYQSSAKELRALAVELHAFADEQKRKKYKGIKNDSITDAADELMGLSNSFFVPYNCPNMADNRGNHETAKKIRALLGIERK